MKSCELLAVVITALAVLIPVNGWAGEKKIELREYLDKKWTNELLTYPFSAPENTCHPDSVTLIGPEGRQVPVQLSDVELWSATKSVKTAKLWFIADLEPLSINTYIVHYDKRASERPRPGADLRVKTGNGQVEITTSQFGARLLQGQEEYTEPAPAGDVAGPVARMRLKDGTWFGGSRLYGPGKLKGYSATVTDGGPVFARVGIRYTYENGNGMDVFFRIVVGDNTIHCQTQVEEDQPADGFRLVLSRNLPPLVFQVQDERRGDRDLFHAKAHAPNEWAEMPLGDYEGPEERSIWTQLADPRHEVVTSLTPWEDWFGTFTQTRIRLKLAETERELQIRSRDPGAWVEPRPIEEIFSPQLDPDPAKGFWLGWSEKLAPIVKDLSGDVCLQVNAAQGVRKWTVSECLSMQGVAGLFYWYGYKPESEFPPQTRPTISYRLNEVKDYVLDWPTQSVEHPLLFVSREDLERRWARDDVDQDLFEKLVNPGSASSPESLPYSPNRGYQYALGAYLLSGGSEEVAEQILLVERLRQALRYELYGMQFGAAGAPTSRLYDAVIDSSLVSETEREVLRSRMAYFVYRLTDPAVWSAERGYASGNQNMTVTWEISRGLAACAIPTHPMAKEWYGKAERIMDYFLSHMVGPAGEWPEAMGGHGRTSVNMIIAFAIASSNSGLHDYLSDPRVKRLAMYWAKMQTPPDPRPRGHASFAEPGQRYFPAMGRDSISNAGGTCGVMAQATSQSDPDYASALQWAWLEEGGVTDFNHLGGFSYVACDPQLPATTPNWTSEVLPFNGALLRHGLDTPNEHQVTLYSGDHFAAFYPNHAGSFPTIFAYGTPVAGSFPGGYQYQEGYLTCHVGLARELESLEERTSSYGYHGRPSRANMWAWPYDDQIARFGEHGGRAHVSGFSTLSRQDYVAVDVAKHYRRRMKLDWKKDLPEWPPVPEKGKPPVDWRRQVLFLKDDDPAEPAYLLIRDTVQGSQPTMWQMWTVSETMDRPENVSDVESVLANKPGNKILPARELEGDRFTAIGQLGVDVEYYIASPPDTPRHTLRWGTDMRDWANKLGAPEYQDLLHLQMPGDGTYYVAFFPRKRNMPAPSFSTLGDGRIIKVSGEFGTDYGFLSARPTTASGEKASFRGTAGSVQKRNEGLVLTLGASGKLSYENFGVEADFPVALRVADNKVTVELPEAIQPPAFDLMQPFPGGTVRVSPPGEWSLARPIEGMTLKTGRESSQLTVPAGVDSVSLVNR